MLNALTNSQILPSDVTSPPSPPQNVLQNHSLSQRAGSPWRVELPTGAHARCQSFSIEWRCDHCMHVCMHAFTYVCMHSRMYACVGSCS